jgi:5'-nucleotidase
MNILISNDDGIHAPGIKALAKALSSLGELEVMAPDRNKSAASNSLTLSNPIRVKQLNDSHYSVEGTPTDCVHIALTGFFKTQFDIVVSGINEGANLGDDILYSGTVAAAMEGRYLGLPAIAVSMVGDNIKHYETGAIIAMQLVKKLQTERLPSQTILNVNVPDRPLKEIKGLEVTRLGKRHSADPVEQTLDPRGKPIYWIGPPGGEADAGPGTDFNAVARGSVSITPLHLDLTHYKLFEEVATWMDGINWAL